MANASPSTRFNVKGFTSLVLLVASLVMAISGVVLYIGPGGPAARGWTLLWLGKGQWNHLHMTSALLFLVAAVFHLIWNWGLLWGYLKRKAKGGLNLKVELAVALLVGAVFVAGTILDVPPFRSFFQLKRAVGGLWSVPAGEAAPGHGLGHGPAHGSAQQHHGGH